MNSQTSLKSLTLNLTPTEMTNIKAYLPQQAPGVWIARGATQLMMALGCGALSPAQEETLAALTENIKSMLGSNKPSFRDSEGFGLWHYWAAGPYSADEKIWKALRKVIKSKQDNTLAHNGEHPLYRLLLKGDEKGAMLWAGAAHIPQDVQKEGETLWHAVAWGGKNPEAFSETLSLDIINIHDDEGLTPGMIAVHRGSRDVLRSWMFLGADPDVQDEGGRTILHHAALYGDIAWFTELQDMGCCDTIKNGRGHTPRQVLQEYMRQSNETDRQMMRDNWTRLYQKKLFF